MEKVRFRNTIAEGVGNWNGDSLPTSTPEFTFVAGFTEATLPFGVGRLPAALYGKAPACDCYLVLITMWTNRDPVDEDLVGIDTTAPQRTRESWAAIPGNAHAALVRPDDTIWFFQTTAGDAVLELLIEPLANTNEFGEVLMKLAQVAAESAALAVATEALEVAQAAVPKVANQPAAEFTVSLNTPPDGPDQFIFSPQYDGEFRWFTAIIITDAILTTDADLDLVIDGMGYGTPLHFDAGDGYGAVQRLFLADANFTAGSIVTVIPSTGNNIEIYVSVTLDMIRH